VTTPVISMPWKSGVGSWLVVWGVRGQVGALQRTQPPSFVGATRFGNFCFVIMPLQMAPYLLYC